jgi:uncharacterized protein
METMSQMTFRLCELPAEREFQLSRAFVRDALLGLPGQSGLFGDEADPELGDLRVSAELSEAQGSVLARGDLRGWALVACSRCLGRARLAVDEPFVVTLLPRVESADPSEEVELNEDDLDVATYTGEEVDLSPVLRDHLVLAVPYAPLCAEDCRGLCARCGADLNRPPCACPPADVDPRLAVLKDLKPVERDG